MKTRADLDDQVIKAISGLIDTAKQDSELFKLIRKRIERIEKRLDDLEKIMPREN